MSFECFNHFSFKIFLTFLYQLSDYILEVGNLNKKQVVVAIIIVAIGAGIWVTIYQLQEQEEIESFSLSILHDKDFILHEFSGNGSAVNPFIIENKNTNDEKSGIRIAYTTSFCIIRNCEITHNGIGIQIEEVRAGTIVIANNEIKNGFKGIELLQSDNITVTNNICDYAQDFGVILRNSLYAVVNDNTCRSNRVEIEVRASSNNKLFYNLLQENKEYGVSIDNGMLTYSENNHIYSNRFINNYEDDWIKAQAYDEGHDNLWYNQQTNTGNYWSDCSDEKEYIIDGYADSIDHYPIEET
jgi:parallel beta-helix repeat protein